MTGIITSAYWGRFQSTLGLLFLGAVAKSPGLHMKYASIPVDDES
jgi:hypothetical protein